MKAILGLATLVFGGWVARQQATTTYKSPTGILSVSYLKLQIEGPQSDHPHAVASGSPVVVRDSGQGAIVSGNNVDVGLLKLPKGLTALQSAIVKGRGHLTLDSAVADQARKEAAANAGKPYEAPTGTQVTNLDSDSYSYTSEGIEGTIVLPGAWTCHQDSKGAKPSEDKKSTVTYVGSFDASGSSGVMHVFLKADGSYDKPKNGHISGPVKFNSVRTETDSVTKTPAVTAFSGSCDNVDMDFTTSPGTIVATGHVVIDGGESTGLGHTTCDRLVLYLDKDLNLIRVEGSGSGKTAVKSKDGSH